MARRETETRRNTLEFDVPRQCCSNPLEIWRRVSEFLDAGWTGFVLESDREGESSSMCVRVTNSTPHESSGLLAKDGLHVTLDGTSGAVERPTKRARVFDVLDTASVESASKDVSQSETVQESSADSASSAQEAPEPTLSLRINVEEPASVEDSSGARAATVTSTATGSQEPAVLLSDCSSSTVRVEFLTGSASSRSEFWKLAETLKADVLRNNRRWRRRAKLAAAAAVAATPGAGSAREPKAVSCEGEG